MELSQLTPNTDPNAGDHIRVITATVTIYPDDPNLSTWVYSGLALDKDHQINGAFDSIETQFSATPDSLGAARTIPIVITLTGADNGLSLLQALLKADPGLQANLLDPNSTDVARSIDIVLQVEMTEIDRTRAPMKALPIPRQRSRQG